VTFHGEETGFAALRVKVAKHRDLVTVVGTLASVSAGEWIEAKDGCLKNAPNPQAVPSPTGRRVPGAAGRRGPVPVVDEDLVEGAQSGSLTRLGRRGLVPVLESRI